MSGGPRYTIEELIAAGGMAQVYRGVSSGIEGFRKKVAIKRVLPKLSANQDFINMFLDEARLCAYLTHSRCVQVFDIGKGGGSHFIVMEYVEGADLKAVQEYLARSNTSMPLEVACHITLQICEGLAYAHNAKDHTGRALEIVHRDVSPHNVLMTRYGEVKLVDFGLARASSHLTAEDEDIVKGKFGYLAPEVTLRQGVNHRADIFAAGILLWEMLAGRRLFLGSTDLETFKLVQAAQVPDIRQLRPDATDNLWKVLLKALWRDPEYRYQSADDFARDLSIVLAQMRRPTTYQDIARLVRAAADARAATKPSRPRSDLIGELILETLHDFSEGDGDELASSYPPSRGAVSAVSPQYEDPTAWGLEAALNSSLPPPPSQAPTQARPAPKPQPPTRRVDIPESRRPRRRSQIPAPPDVHDGPWWRRWFN